LSADDEGAAPVGVTETTSDIAHYAHPNNHMLKFWDLPGVGTPSFPRDSYLEAIQVKRAIGRMTEDRDIWRKYVREGWLGSRVVSVLDSGVKRPGFKSQPRRCRV